MKPHTAVNLFGFILIAALLLLFGTAKSQSVAPLCTAKWHQGYPYNALCPDKNGSPAPVGCVPLAVAVRIRYDAPNIFPQGEASYHEQDAAMTPRYVNLNGVTYNWNMPDVLTSVTTDIPRFLKDVGFTCGAKYASGGNATGACLVDSGCAVVNGYRWSPSAYTALKYNWGYDSTTLKEIWCDQHSVSWLDSVYKSNLDKHQPFLLCGGQHCWVVDGYDVTGKFHFTGGLSGWYDVHNLGAGYGEWRQALVGIKPANGAVGATTPCNPVWQCQYSNGELNGYEYDNCGNVRFSASCLNACISNWVCELPLNGYQTDGCGNRRQSTQCKKKGRKINWEEEKEDDKILNVIGQEVIGELQSGFYICNRQKIVIINQ